MASLKYDNLKGRSNTKAKYTDIKFDLELDYSVKGNFALDAAAISPNKQYNILDVKVNRDAYAIIGSVINIINTRKGQRPLVPKFGSDVLSYVFSPISGDGGYQVGEAIKDSIEKWEPRVVVNNITVRPDPDLGEYNITIELYSPVLKQNIGIVGGLSQNTGFFDIRG